jgi:hypothetical protein
MFVLRAEIVTILEPKMVTISARNINIYKWPIKYTISGQSLIYRYMYNITEKDCPMAMPRLQLSIAMNCKSNGK